MIKDEVSHDDKASFNMGVATLRRIDTILNEIKLARTAKEYVIWFDTLTSLFMEIIPFMKGNEDKQVAELFKQSYVSLSPVNKRYLNTLKLDKNLLQIEADLRKMLHKYDLLMPTKGDPARALMGG